ncbi:hypothetical protein [Microcoleus sp. Aus8_D3]|uniref:hypothetical protein n=1 Tax=Microcoleus sp. Aus8_D3 TaxID=2818633 RepID=UPI002FD3E1E0
MGIGHRCTRHWAWGIGHGAKRSPGMGHWLAQVIGHWNPCTSPRLRTAIGRKLETATIQTMSG